MPGYFFCRRRQPAPVLNQTAQIFDLTGVARVVDRFAQLKADYERNGAARSNLTYGYIYKPKV